MVLVAKETGLQRRGGTWSVRICIPKDLWQTFGPFLDKHRGAPSKRRKASECKQVWEALEATTHAEAKIQARLKKVLFDGLYREARAGAAKPAPQSAASLEGITRAVRAYFHQLEQGATSVPYDADDRMEAYARAIEDAGGMHGTPSDDGNLQLVAKDVAAKAGMTIPPGSELYVQLMAMVKAAMDEHASREVDRLGLQPVGRSHPHFADIAPNKPLPHSMTLAEAITAFKADPAKASVTPATVQARRFKFAAWQELLGPERAVAAISRQEINDARDALMKVPAHAAQHFPGKTLREASKLAERTNLPLLGAKSVKLYIEALSSLFTWLKLEGHISQNWAEGVSAPSAPKEDPRRPFTHTELSHLFTTGPYAATSSGPREWKFWAPLIALFHGLRSGEVLGLEARDVGFDDSVPVLFIRENAMRALKNAQSQRTVPIHPELQALGFMEFAARSPAGGPLFQNLPGEKGPSIDAAGKVLVRWIRAEFSDKELVFHSFRHTWTDAIREAEIPDEIQERLGGWKLPGRSARGGYGMGVKTPRLAAEIAKINYPGLSLPC